jgi:intraflagellar transport protein 122
LAIGMQSGLVTLHNTKTEETHRIQKSAPAWCLTFIHNVVPTKGPASSAADDEMIVIGVWNKTLAFHKLLPDGNTKVHVERAIKYYPCGMNTANSGNAKNQYLLVSGSNKKLCLYSKDGVQLSELITNDSWIMSNANQKYGEKMLIGTHSGHVEMNNLTFDSVHTFYQEKYAFRENLTDIVIHHLAGDRKVRIKCKDIIRSISLYKSKLAVQLSDKVCVYESNADEDTDMHFRARKERMTMSERKSDLMVVTSQHLLFTIDNVVELYSFGGIREKVWYMESSINFIRVDGGPEGREGVIYGLENGVVGKIFVDNPFPLTLNKRENVINCADSNLIRTMVASVDENGVLEVIDLHTQTNLFRTGNVVSVAFNSEVKDMICYTTKTSMYIVSGIGASANGKATTLDPDELPFSGQVVAFKGQKIYCLDRSGSISRVDVPQQKSIQQAMEQNDLVSAQALACLGATEANWKQLGMRALRQGVLSVAKNAFERLKDIRYLTFIENLQRDGDDDMARLSNTAGGVGKLDFASEAEILAYEGHYNEAAKLYTRNGRPEEATRIFTDLRMWDEAKTYAQAAGQNVRDLNEKQAQWLKEIKDWRGASALRSSLGQVYDAVKIVIDSQEEGWDDHLIQMLRGASADQKDAFIAAGDAFSGAGKYDAAREAYEKGGNLSKLLNVYAKAKMWDEAIQLQEETKADFDKESLLPFAEWLVSQDKHEEAMSAYKKADRSDLSHKVLADLTSNAISENRFKDAAYYFYILSKESDLTSADAQAEYQRKADLYYAYNNIHEYITSPFTSHQPETLFQTSRFILNSLGRQDETVPFGISKMATVYTLARNAMALGAYKLARFAYDSLGKLKLPGSREAEVHLDMLKIQAKPIMDNADHTPVCYRCSSTNPFLNPFSSKYTKGDVCINCGHPFVRSFITFDVLPLVEFVPDPSITDDEAIAMIREDPSSAEAKSMVKKKRNEFHSGGVNMLMMDDNYESKSGGDNDPFAMCLNTALESQQNHAYTAVIADVATLLSMKRGEVYICHPDSKDKRATFYKNMLPEISIAISQPCSRFFHLEDFEFAYLSTRSCPYSKVKNVGEYGSL